MQKRYGSFMICDNIPYSSGRIRLKWKDEASCFFPKKKRQSFVRFQRGCSYILDDY